MKKRGDISLWFLVELIGAFLVAYMAVNISLAYAQGTIFEKLNVAKDIRIQINSIIAVPGDTYLINDNLHGYSIKIEENKIEVFESKDEIAKGVSYFANAEGSELDFTLINSEEQNKKLVISKIGGKVSISDEIPNLS